MAIPIHIGKIIQKQVQDLRLSYKDFGALIHKNEKTVPNIFERSTMSIDLLITISAALKTDLLNIFYEEEPMKSLRDDEVAQLNKEIQKLVEEINHLKKELALTQDLRDAQKDIIYFAKVQLDEYKLKLKEPLKKVASTNEGSENKSDHTADNKM
jgi:hypothetical protein